MQELKKDLLKVAKPVLFNTEMVRAMLEDRKTATRRIVKPQLSEECPSCKYVHNEYIYDVMARNIYCARCGEPLKPEKRAPYHPGDILYVRETWNHYRHTNLVSGEHREGYFYKASPEMKDTLPNYVQYHWGQKWKPSIHMPKEAARIFLKVKDVRVERLQDMTENDAFAEGVSPWDDRCYARNEWKPTFYDPDSGGSCCPLYAFEDIWDSTIKNKADIPLYGWDANPWVWVIEFERIKLESEV